MLKKQSSIMKKLVIAISLTFATSAAMADSVTVNGTRFIFPSDEKEITVQLTNHSKAPTLIQTWLDEGDSTVSPDEITTPFTISPPIAKIEGMSGQSLRIKAINKAIIPTDKESLWYLNILEIPPTITSSQDANKNKLQIAIRSRFKFIYRPVNLGVHENVKDKLRLMANGNSLKIENPTPFYVTITTIRRDKSPSIINDAVLIAPKSTEMVKLKSSVHSNEKLQLTELNDYGTEVKFEKTVQ